MDVELKRRRGWKRRQKRQDEERMRGEKKRKEKKRMTLLQEWRKNEVEAITKNVATS